MAECALRRLSAPANANTKANANDDSLIFVVDFSAPRLPMPTDFTKESDREKTF